MGYRKITPVLEDLDNLAGHCGLFDGNTNLNNGYGCASRSKTKAHPGCCYSFDCPLAYPADLDDLKEHDEDLYQEYVQDFAERGLQPYEVGSEWMVQYQEVAK